MRIQDIGRTMTQTRAGFPLRLVALAALASCRGGCRREAATIARATVRGGWRCSRRRRGRRRDRRRQLRASPAAAKLPQLAQQNPGRQERARGVRAPHRLRSAQAARQRHGRLPRGRARAAASSGSSCAPSARRDAPGRLRARSAAEDGRRSGRDAARPLHAVVVEAAIPTSSASSSTSRLRAGRGRVGPRMADLAESARPATAPPPTSIWCAWSSAPPARTRSGRAAIVPGRDAQDARRPIRGSADAARSTRCRPAIDFGKGARGAC